MKSARNQFILVGFLCQGLAWDSGWYWLFAPILWTLALSPLRKRIAITPTVELASLIGGSAVALLLGKVTGQSSHFFLGDGVVALQAARMMRPLSRREKLASVLMACFHVAVSCTLAPDVRFLLLALAALILLPKSLVELQSEDFDRDDSRLEWNVLIPLTLVAIAIFITIPRFAVGGPIQLGPGTGQGGLLSSVLDPSSGGYANSSQVLMQIEGKNLRYLKCMALSQFDGREWRLDDLQGFRQFPRVPETDLDSYLHRRIRVKQVRFLGRILPTDGVPVFLRGKFFSKPMLNTQGVIECSSTWNSANNQYEYWVNPNPAPETLSAPMIRYHTQNPGASPKLSEWLDRVTDGATNQLDLARHLEIYLRRNFKYKLGAPALNRLDALEDFIFDKQEGHCERFASALALLLRMHNIPTRIAIGYVPGPQSRFSDWRQVRFKDAHAWTEAWFPDKGWLTFDATPGGGGDDFGYGFTQLMESLDLVWYSHVISFDGATQKEILASAMNGLSAVPGRLKQHLGLFFFLLCLGFTPWLYGRARALAFGRTASKAQIAISDADHFYAELLRLLARHGHHLEPGQTPLEFLEQLRAREFPGIERVEAITQAFCESHYGEQPLPAQRLSDLRAMLQGMERAKDFSTKTLAPGRGDL